MMIRYKEASRSPLAEFPHGDSGAAAAIWYVRETTGMLPALATYKERFIKQVAHRGGLVDLQAFDQRERPRECLRLYGVLRSAGISEEALDRMYATVDTARPYYWNPALFRPMLHVTDSAIAPFSQKNPQARVDAAVALASVLIFANLDALATARQVSEPQTVEQVRALFKNHARKTLVGDNPELSSVADRIDAVFDSSGAAFSFRGAMLLCMLPGQTIHNPEYVLGRTLNAQTIIRLAAPIKECVLQHLAMKYKGVDSKRYCQARETYQLFQNIERKYARVGIDDATAALSTAGDIFDPKQGTLASTYTGKRARFTEEAERLLFTNYLESSIPYWFLSSPTVGGQFSYPD